MKRTQAIRALAEVATKETIVKTTSATRLLARTVGHVTSRMDPLTAHAQTDSSEISVNWPAHVQLNRV